MTHYLECPECGDSVFGREEPWWYEDEQETCSVCGTRLVVRVEDDDTEYDPDNGVGGHAYADTTNRVEDRGQCRCDGSWCGAIPEYQGGPCRWDCERARKERS